MSTIVVGVDSSEGAREALRFALEEAKLRHAAVRAVHAWRYIPAGAGYIEAGFQAPEVDPAELQRAAEAALDATVAEAAGTDEDAIERRTVEGPAAAVLVDESRDADLLVVGSRGHGGFTGLLLGSVSQHVAQHASCPVVIVRSRGKEGSR